jgi:hypothetical protein
LVRQSNPDQPGIAVLALFLRIDSAWFFLSVAVTERYYDRLHVVS